MVKTLGLISRPDSAALELSAKIYRHLRSKRISTLLEPKLAKFVGVRSTEIEKMNADVIIAVGGDGTVLRTVMHLPKSTPILGINLGLRGFLALVRPNEAVNAVDSVLQGNYAVDKRALISTDVNGDSQPDALNEVLVVSRSRGKTILLEVRKDGDELFRRSADGIIVATPTGSTAYSLSAGGSVLDPDIGGFIITPLCPIRPMPPIVVPSKSKIQIRFLKPRKAELVIDGCYMRDLRSGDIVNIKRSRKKAPFIRIRKGDFYREFRERLPL